MTRKRRTWHPDFYYHIVSRGNRRDALFLDERDFNAFMFILHKTSQRHPFTVCSYCFMTNHYHLQLKSPITSISTLMAIVNKRYASYYNNRYRLTGHVFEERFFSEGIISEKGMLEVSRYIHLNPVKANIIHDAAHYVWSSYRYYSQEDKYSLADNFFDPSPVLQIFTGNISEQREKYRQYINMDENETRLSFVYK
ncbi:transposase [Bacillus salitolerans]|uniref:Transposase n=1 Tax=Bacillus salitolerans TaxID=1437434 RepID=A0ABW4LKD4_9BACI